MGLQLPTGARRLTCVRPDGKSSGRDKRLESERLPPEARRRHCDGFARPLGFTAVVPEQKTTECEFHAFKQRWNY